MNLKCKDRVCSLKKKNKSYDFKWDSRFGLTKIIWILPIHLESFKSSLKNKFIDLCSWGEIELIHHFSFLYISILKLGVLEIYNLIWRSFAVIYECIKKKRFTSSKEKEIYNLKTQTKISLKEEIITLALYSF